MDHNVLLPTKARVSLAIAVALLLLPAAPVQAGWLTSYTLTTDVGSPDLTNVLLLEAGENWGTMTWAFGASGYGATTTIDNPFAHENLPTFGLVFGLVTGLPDDGESPLEHLVLFMNNEAAAAAAGIAWEALFPGVSEESIIEALKMATSGGDWSGVEPALVVLNDFANGPAATGILGADGEPIPAWLTIPGYFSVVAFSDGAIIGTGTSSATFVPAAVPEPTSVALAGLGGLAVLAYDLKRRRSAA